MKYVSNLVWPSDGRVSRDGRVTYVFQRAAGPVPPAKVHEVVQPLQEHETLPGVGRYRGARESHLARPELHETARFSTSGYRVTKQRHFYRGLRNVTYCTFR